MATLTVYAETGGGGVASSSATYSTARSSGTLAATVADGRVGQNQAGGTFSCYEAFLSFDTSVLGPEATVTAAVLHIYGRSAALGANFGVEISFHDWTAGGLTTGDWIAGASLPSSADAGGSTVGFSTSGYNPYTFVDLSGIDTTGTTEIVIASDRHRGATQPVAAEFLVFWTSEQTGTDKDPKLVITYTAPASLTIQNATHAHTSENLTLTETSASTLGVNGTIHAHSSDNLDLTQAHTLTVADATHGHFADNVVFVGEGEPGTVTIAATWPTVEFFDVTPTVTITDLTPTVEITEI